VDRGPCLRTDPLALSLAIAENGISIAHSRPGSLPREVERFLERRGGRGISAGNRVGQLRQSREEQKQKQKQQEEDSNNIRTRINGSGGMGEQILPSCRV
jgi:hypothetical protein